eukprot:CAMPEP_0201571362 /NCGR_PEP_ID=MMETSP0190_2-20130828/14115_1 /ASSEMBLY_ACC=CAM_ASM_000263 /TAXON_ID=37353 /ORGANISM="Rosalina sp." /LENGTH=156 /DNA_ID=CAMNT_0047995937 /DNA_START=127 /DNA_END=597 /DNA_ORIENTATION=+
MGFVTLNDIFKKKYFHPKDHEAVILIDGYVDDFGKITQYKQWLTDCASNGTEYQELAGTIKEMDNEIKALTNALTSKGSQLSNDARTQYTTERKKLMKEKERLINRRFELNDLISEAKEEPMTDPKRDLKWDKRLMTSWDGVWRGWTDLLAYKNFI